MSIKSVAAKLFAKIIYKKTLVWASNPVVTQQKVFQNLCPRIRWSGGTTNQAYGVCQPSGSEANYSKLSPK